MSRDPSIRAQLRRFVALVLVGAGTGAILLALAVAGSVTLEEAARLEAIADLTVNATEAAAEGTRDLLATLAARPEVRRMDPEVCSAFLQQAVSFMPRHVGATVTDLQGRIRCLSTGETPEVAPYVTDRVWFQKVRARDAFVIGPPVEGRLSGASVVVFAHPVRDEQGRTIGYVSLSSPTLERFRTLVAGLGDQRTVVTLATDAGLVVARSHDAEAWVGRTLPPSGMPMIDGGGASRGVNRADDLDGTPRLWAYRDIPGYGWRVFAGVPRTELRVLALRRALPPLAFFTALLLILAGIMFRVRNSVDSSLSALEDAVRRSREDLSVRAPRDGGPAEVVAVAEEFNRTLSELDAALAREEEVRTRLQSVLNNAVFGIFVCDLQGRIEACNPAMVAMLGFRSETQVAALTVADLFMTPHEADELLTTPAGSRGSAEVHWRGADGTTVPVRLHWTAWRDGRGRVLVQGIAEDVSERRELEVQFRQAQKLDAVGRLAGGVAHDFNNRLTVISGEAELLLLDLPPDDPARESVEIIAKSADRAAELTAQLLAFSRRQPLSPRRLDPARVAVAMTPMLGRLLGEGIILDTDWGPVPEVLADGGQLEQVLLNLMTNARDAVAGQGTIGLSTHTAVLDRTEAAQRHPPARPGPYAVLVVTDDGEGMDPAVMDHIFEPFFTTKPTGKGTGLGLATVYGIVTQYGGHLRVDSRPEDGARIEVWLPAAPPEGEEPVVRDREADLPVPSAFAPLPPPTPDYVSGTKHANPTQ